MTKLEELKTASFGTPEWEESEKRIELKRRLCEVYGIGTEIETPDGIGTILSIHSRAVAVSLKQITTTQVLHGFQHNTGCGLHRTYLFKDFDCPLILNSLENITDDVYLEICFQRYGFQMHQLRGKMTPEHLNQKQTDYLRSKKYAIPLMGVYVDEAVEQGFIKLK